MSVSGLGYYDHGRSDLLALFPTGAERVLEIGCGAGGMAAGMRERGAKELVGVEINPEAAVHAKTQFDRVIVGSVEEVIALLPNGFFDLIVYGDVLEHLIDPWTILARHGCLLKPSGYVLLSVPNVRHWRLLYDLVIRGNWTYEDDGGTLDRTHLRFFTRSTILEMVGGAGYQVVSEHHNEFGSAARWLDYLSFGVLREFLVWQYFILARPKAEAAAGRETGAVPVC
ncbi:MAG: class I SAM-dependent methyltransferase [Nitrospirota bacterium]|nr:class I SAM-dependent methyltransferase [Nitrospirota bacterium]